MPSNRESPDLLGIADGYPELAKYEQSDDDEKLVNGIMELWRRAYDHRLPWERRWEFNRLYLKGDTVPMRDRFTGEVVTVQITDTKRLNSLNNQLSPASRNLVAKLARMIPAFTIIPPSNDTMEMHGARVADAYLAYFRHKERFDVKFIEAQEFLPWNGTAIYHLRWDPEAGREMAMCPDCEYRGPAMDAGMPCPKCFEMIKQAETMSRQANAAEETAAIAVGEEPPPPAMPPKQEPPKLELATEGDAVIRIIDSRDFFPEPGVTDPTYLRYAITREPTPVTEVRRRFPHMAAFIEEESDVYADRTSRFATASIDEIHGGLFLREYVNLYTYHEAPTLEYPKGRIVYIANKHVLDEEEGNYDKFNRLPFYFNWWQRRPGEFWGEPFITQAWHRQRELNLQETMLREHMELMVRQRILDPIGSRIAADEFMATSAQRIKYNAAAGKPEFLQPPPLPSDVYNRRAMLVEDIRQQAAITANEAGQMGSDPNGRAMAIVQAEADQQLGPIVVRNFNEIGELFRGVLILVQSMYDRQRKFTVPGDESTETYAFDELNLAPGWDIRLEVQDGLAQNQPIRIQQAMDLLNAGVLGVPGQDPNVPKKFAKLAKLKLPGLGSDPTETEAAAALEIPAKIMRGEQVQPSMVDDPEVFADTLTGWLRTIGRRRGFEDPVVQQVLQIWQYYVQQVQQRQAMQMQQAAPQPGQEGSKAGSDQSAPGGSANNPGRIGAAQQKQQDESGEVQEQASQEVQQADRRAEQTARGSSPHES